MPLCQRNGGTPLLNSPDIVKDYLRCRLDTNALKCSWRYGDAQHWLIEMQTLFRGTLAQTSVYPREVVRVRVSEECRGGDPRPQSSVRFNAAESG